VDSNLADIKNNKNYGKGNSIIEGLRHANGEYVIFQDADLEYDPENYNKLLEKIIDNNLDLELKAMLIIIFII